MAINISTRNYRFLVNGKDYSNALIESNNWDTNGIDQTGLVKTTASFTLAQVRDLPGSLDDRINTADWNIGKSVQVQIADSTGILRVHPCGALRILSSSWNYENQRLLLFAGCLISLLSFKAPTDPINELELEPAKLTDRSEVASQLLRAAGINTIIGLGNLPYPLYYPFPISGSYLETAGKILYAALRFGRINSNEAFVIEPITLNQSSSISWQIGGDTGSELYYRRLSSGGEAPRELIEVRGTRQVGETPTYPILSRSERYGEARFIDPELSSGTVLFERLETRETYGGNRLERNEKKEQPLGLVIPNTNSATKLSLVESHNETTIYNYEATTQGKLATVESKIYKLKGEVLKEYYEYLASIDNPNANNNKDPFLAQTSLTEYFYNSKGEVRAIITKVYRSRGELLSGLDTDWAFTLGITPDWPIIAEINTEEWNKQSNNFWIHRVTNYKTAGVVNPSFFSSQEKPATMSDETFEDNQRSQQLGLIIDNNASLFERSNSGQTVPPATERRPQKVVLDSEEVCGEAIFSLYGGNPYKEKKRTYSVEYLGSRKRGIDEDTGEPIIEGLELCDDAQCKEVASLEGALLAGRFKGQDIGVDIKDELLSWRPLMALDCTEPDGTIRRYALDDSHWYLGQNRAIANFGAIWLGDKTRNGNLAKPYAIAHIFTGTEVVGGNILSLPYSLFLPNQNFSGGEVIGGDILSLNTLQPGQVGFRGGEVIGGSVNITTVVKLPNINIRGGMIFGGAIISYLSGDRALVPFRGGDVCGGNIEIINTRLPGQIAIRGGETIGGIIKPRQTLKLSGGIVEGGKIIIESAIASSWNNLNSNDWNTLTNNNWNSLN